MKGILKFGESNPEDHTDYNSNPGNKEYRAENTKMARMLLRLKIDIHSVKQSKSPVYGLDAEITFKTCQLSQMEQNFYDHLLSKETKQLIANPDYKLSPCSVVNIHRIKSDAITRGIYNILLGLVQEYGIKFDMIVAMTEREIKEDFENTGNGTILAIAPFPISGSPFKNALIINLKYINQCNTITQLDNLYLMTLGSTFVVKNFKDGLNHEYGHLLTTPRDFNLYLQFMIDTQYAPKKHRYEEIDNACQISNNACEKNGRELLAEIFTLYKKGRTLDPKWKLFFNKKNIVKSKPIN